MERNDAMTSSERGSSLVIAVILLGVMSVVGAAAVTLSSSARKMASGKAQVDGLSACAQAAQARIWAEITKYGPSALSSTAQVSSITIGGNTLTSPAHYDFDPGAAPMIKDVVFTGSASGGEGLSNRDMTNSFAGSRVGKGQAYGLVAHCKDEHGRQYEVELTVRFAMF
jgi:hypothetical protein